MDKADSLLFHHQNDSATFYFMLALPILEKLTAQTRDSMTWLKYATTLYNLGYTTQESFEMDSSQHYLNRCLTATQERFGRIHLLTTLTLRKMEKNFMFKGEYNNSRNHIFEGFEISLKLKDQNPLFLGMAYQNMAYQNFLLNDREKMEIYYNKTEEIYESLYRIQDPSPNGSDTAGWQWKFPNSIVAYFPRHYVDYHLRTAYNHLMVGRIRNAQYNFDQAYNCYLHHRQVQSMMKFRIDNIRVHLLLYNGSFESALRLADSTIEFTRNDTDRYIFIDAYESKALTYETMGRWEDAFQCMKKCFDIYRPKGDEGILLYMRSRLAQLALNARRFDFSRSIVDSMIGKFMPEVRWDHPEPVEWTGREIYILKNMLPLLKHKFLIEMASLSNRFDPGEAMKTLKIFNAIHEATVSLHERTYTDVNRLVHERDHHLLYEKAIELTQKLFGYSGDSRFLLKGLKWSEASKSVILTREMVGQNQNRPYASSRTQRQLADLRRKVKTINYELAELHLRDSAQDSEMRLRLQGRLAALYGEMEILKERNVKELESGQASQIRNEYPIQTVRQNLKEEQSALIDFFYGDSLISIYLLTPDTLMNVQLVKSLSFDETVERFIDHIKIPKPNNLKEIDSLAQKLYQFLLEPFAPWIAGLNLVIIPDGLLCFLPFEYLVTPIRGFQAVRYEYSSGLYVNKPGMAPHKRYMGFAPEYSGRSTFNQSRGDSILLDDMYSTNRASLGFLKYNVPEVRECSKILEGQGFTGKQINKSLFFSHARQAGILHLALHALANDQNPDYSQLLLNSEQVDMDFEPLYAYQIKELDLNAELAILSACNTGAGKYQHGNGVESLAKAFNQAGCNNILMSLWPVNDASTKEIVVGFIKNLKNGLGKADALAKAKQNYLAAAPEEMKHPYYWAGLVLIGDNEPMFGLGPWESIGPAQIGLLLGLFALMPLILFKYRTDRRSRIGRQRS